MCKSKMKQDGRELIPANACDGYPEVSYTTASAYVCLRFPLTRNFKIKIFLN